jgi:hypothetical protein
LEETFQPGIKLAQLLTALLALFVRSCACLCRSFPSRQNLRNVFAPGLKNCLQQFIQ